MPLSPLPVVTPNLDISLVTATAIVDEIPPSLAFIEGLLYPRGTPINTEDYEIVLRKTGKTMAPYIKPGTVPPAIKGIDVKFSTVKTPMIGLQRPFQIADWFLRSYPQSGSYRYHSSAHQAAMIEQMTVELEQLTIMVENRMEWMAASLLNRTVSYDGIEDAFTITYPKDASTEFTLAATFGWDDLVYTDDAAYEESCDLTNPALTVQKAGRVMNETVRLQPTHCILGTKAAELFVNHPRVMKQLDARNFNAGSLTLQEQYSTAGARYLGRYCGVEWWEYAAQLTLDSGSTGKLISDNDAYFIHVGPQAQFDKVYGLIPNWKMSIGRTPTQISQLLSLRPVPARQFTDVLPDQHGNAISAVNYTRPLHILRRPDCIVKVTVVSA